MTISPLHNNLSSNKNVVILAPPCGDIEQSVARAFRVLGWGANVITYGDIRPRHFIERTNLSLSPESRQNAIQQDFNAVIKAQLLPLAEEVKPSIILVLKGHRLDEKSTIIIKKLGVPIITWAYDSLSRCLEMSDIISISTHTFYIDGGDVPEGVDNATWLPLGYDETIFKADPDMYPEYDVLFVGTLGKCYSRRRHFLKLLSNSRLVHDWKVAFIGTTGKRINDWRLNLNPLINWIGKRVSIEELAFYASKAKICINIHQDDGIKPINPMFFALPATGACQFVENKAYFSNWMKTGEYVSFDDDNFLETLYSVLTNENLRVNTAKSGMDCAIEKHTYVERVRCMCSILGRII